jgi:hypothetical protein
MFLFFGCVFSFIEGMEQSASTSGMSLSLVLRARSRLVVASSWDRMKGVTISEAAYRKD